MIVLYGVSTSGGLAAAVGAGRVAAGLAQSPAEVLVHHGADVPLEVREEHTPGAQVLRLRLLVAAAVLLLDGGMGRVGERAAPAASAHTVVGLLLHFRIKRQFLF